MEPRVDAFREKYRTQEIGPHYQGWLHFAFTSVGALGAIVVACVGLVDVSALEWLTVPATFVFANFGEYFGHRGPMHHRQRYREILYKRHTLQHHRFYTHERMASRTHRDFKMVLFPPVMLFFFLGCLAFPIGLALFFIATENVGRLFAATAVGYFLTYEWLHFAYHQPPQSWIGRLPFVATLRKHHTAHHDPALMGRYNFNITFPICDAIFGTTYREEA